jgi:hypothetical protein
MSSFPNVPTKTPTRQTSTKALRLSSSPPSSVLQQLQAQLPASKTPIAPVKTSPAPVKTPAQVKMTSILKTPPIPIKNATAGGSAIATRPLSPDNKNSKAKTDIDKPLQQAGTVKVNSKDRNSFNMHLSSNTSVPTKVRVLPPPPPVKNP